VFDQEVTRRVSVVLENKKKTISRKQLEMLF